MILSFAREQIKAMAQSGLMNIKSLTHWDVCNDLKCGKSMEDIAQYHHLSLSAIEKIKRTKCPDC